MTYTQPATITWADETGVARSFTLSVDALNALEKKRLTIATAPGGPLQYADVVLLVKGYLNQYLVVPSVQENFPPAAQAAYDAYVVAMKAAIESGQITGA